jgi:hypothetical protein
MAPKRKAVLCLVALCLPAAAAQGSAGARPDAQQAQPVPSDGQARAGLTLDLPSVEDAERQDASRATSLPARTEEARAAAEAEAVRVRAANADQLAAAELQTRQIVADQQAQQERLARYREQQQAHDEALTAYAAQVAAAEAARKRWVADVAACKAGDRGRCGAAPGLR